MGRWIYCGSSVDGVFVGSGDGDFFYFDDNHGNDTIENFTPGKDHIGLHPVSGVSQFSDLTITADGSDVLIDTGQGTIRLKNTSINDVDASWFTFRMDGGTGDDTLTGGAGMDTIDGHAGNDTIYGAGGRDHVGGGSGNDTLYGGTGNDGLGGGLGDDTLYGGAGDDRLEGGAGDDTLYGGAGNDRLYGETGDDTLYGGAGKDVFYFSSIHGNDTIEDFTVGTDNIHLAQAGVSGFEDLTITQDGSDVLIDTGQGTIRVKNIDADDLDASSFTFRLEGGSGDDTLSGGGLDDYIYGGAGADTLSGGGDVDEIYGGAGDDTLYGGAGDDRLEGGSGADKIYGGAGFDSIAGGDGDDSLYGGTGAIDTLYGGDGDDSLYGGAGMDVLVGGDGDDRLYGGAGKDTLWGGVGNDTLYGGAGDDSLEGGAGNDTFVFGVNRGNDTIEDFTDGEDKIDLSAITGISGFEDLTVTQDGTDVVISLSSNAADVGTGTIRLENFSIGDLDANDFLFAEIPAPMISGDEL